MVSHGVYQRYTAGVYRLAQGGLAQVSAAVRLWSTAGIPLDIVLWQHQGIERVDRCNLLLADRILYGYTGADDLQATTVVDGAAVLADNGGWRDVHFLVRRSISLRHNDWRGVECCVRALCHMQQEGERGRAQSHGADVSDVGRAGAGVDDHSIISAGIPIATACGSDTQRYEPVANAVPLAVLHSGYVSASDSGA